MPSVTTIRVLLVDDSPVLLAALRRFLEEEAGLEVVGQAASAEEAIANVVRLQPDLVLTDVAMPGMSGLELVRHLKGGPSPPQIIVMTIFTEYESRARECGADGFVSKAEIGGVLSLMNDLFAARRAASSEGR